MTRRHPVVDYFPMTAQSQLVSLHGWEREACTPFYAHSNGISYCGEDEKPYNGSYNVFQTFPGATRLSLRTGGSDSPVSL